MNGNDNGGIILADGAQMREVSPGTWRISSTVKPHSKPPAPVKRPPKEPYAGLPPTVCDLDLTRRKPAPRVSIVTPTWNGAQWLAGTYQSLCDQTEQDWEWVCVDNGSHDFTPEFFKCLAHDKRVRFLRLPQNTHISYATNIGIVAASSENILWMDHDDRLYPRCLEALLEKMDEGNFVAVYGRQDFYNPDLPDPDKQHNPHESHEYDRMKLLHFFFVMHPLMARRSVILSLGGCSPLADLAQDAEITHRLADKGEFGFVNEILYEWRLGSVSTSHMYQGPQREIAIRSARAAATRRVLNPSVAFVLPGLGEYGGIRLVGQIANGLYKRGWDTKIVNLNPHSSGEWMHLSCPLLSELPQAVDLAVATETHTCDTVLRHRHGFRAWFVQNWEDWCGEEKFKSYIPCFGDNIVSVGKWYIQDLKANGAGEVTWIPSAVDLDKWTTTWRTKTKVPTVGCIYGHLQEYKNPRGVRKILRILHDRHPDWRLIAFGQGDSPGLDFVEWHHSPPQHEIPELYRSMDVYFQASFHEGDTLPPKEATLCGAAIVVGNKGTEGFAFDGDTALVMPDVDDAYAYVEAIESLLPQSVPIERNGERFIAEKHVLTRGRDRHAMQQRAEAYVRENCGIELLLDRWENWLRATIAREYAAILELK